MNLLGFFFIIIFSFLNISFSKEISGFVKDPWGSPVPNALVSLNNDSVLATFSDSIGFFKFDADVGVSISSHMGNDFKFNNQIFSLLIDQSDVYEIQHLDPMGKLTTPLKKIKMNTGWNSIPINNSRIGLSFIQITNRRSDIKRFFKIENNYASEVGVKKNKINQSRPKYGNPSFLATSKIYYKNDVTQLGGVTTGLQIILEKLPNVVLVLSDDQGWTDYGFMGHPQIETPVMDQLSKEGLLFTRGYTPVSLCRPALMTLSTGFYPAQHGITGNDPPTGSPRSSMLHHIDNAKTLQEILRDEKGYVTFQTGKWWEGSWQRGKFTSGMTQGTRHGDVGLDIGRLGLDPIPAMIDSIGERPFYLWYAPFLPHTPHTPPQRLLDKYTPKTNSAFEARYWAMVEWFDETIGELTDLLKQKDVYKNTLLFYTCDNGWLQNQNGNGTDFNLSKRSPYDLGVRTPIFIKWPLHVTPAINDSSLVSNIDFMPTILAAADIPIPDTLPGIDLLDKLNPLDARITIYGDVYEHDVVDVNEPSASLRYQWIIEGKWKLIVPVLVSQTNAELYDIIADPGESNDIAGANPAVVQDLKTKVEEWYTSIYAF